MPSLFLILETVRGIYNLLHQKFKNLWVKRIANSLTGQFFADFTEKHTRQPRPTCCILFYRQILNIVLTPSIYTCFFSLSRLLYSIK